MLPTIRRLAAAPLLLVVAVAAALFTTGSPAHAADVRLTDGCPYVAIEWSPGHETVYVLRNDVPIGDIDLADTGRKLYAATDGDVFTVVSSLEPGGTVIATHTYRETISCPFGVTTSAEDECFITFITIIHWGEAPFTSVKLIRSGGSPVDLQPTTRGITPYYLGLAEGESYQLTGVAPGGTERVVLLAGVHSRTAACSMDKVTVHPIEDTCDGPIIRITNDNSLPVSIRYAVNGRVTLSPGLPGNVGNAVLVPASPGDMVTAVVGVDTELVRHTVVDIPCASPTPSDSPSGSPDVSGSPEPGSSTDPTASGDPSGSVTPTTSTGAGGGLPITGASVGLLVAFGAALLIGGALLLIARQQRTKFSNE